MLYFLSNWREKQLATDKSKHYAQENNGSSYIEGSMGTTIRLKSPYISVLVS